MAGISAGQVVAHAFFLQDVLGYAPMQPVYWTICLEVQFYLVFSILLLLNGVLNPKDRPIAAGLLHLVPFLGSLAIILGGREIRGFFLEYWYAFAIGAMVRLSAERVVPRGMFPACWSCLVGLVLWRRRSADLVVLGTSATLFVLTRYGLTDPRSRLVALCAALGRISYSLYLIHALIGGLFFFRARRFIIVGEWTMLAFILFTAAMSILAAALMYRFVELPAVRASHLLRIREGSRTPRPASAGIRQDA